MATEPGSAAAGRAPVSLFYIYAHEDEKLRAELERHLKILQLRGLIRPWHDREIVPGQDWDAAIHQHLQDAELVLLLLSSYFVSSDYILGVELKSALQRARDGSATVVPILLRPLDLEGLDGGELPLAPLLQRQGLPRDLKAVTSWRQREEAWVSVSQGLRTAVAAIQARRAAAAPAGATAATDAAGPAGAAGVGLPPPAAPRVRAHAATATAASINDPLLDRVLDNAADGIRAAQQARSGTAPAAPDLRRQALALLGSDHLPRILWVDDQPDGNLAEIDMLARLQIEVVQVRSTDEALARLGSDRGGFDLVLSDWQRPAEGADAALRLQQALQQAGVGVPLVVYHTTFGSPLRDDRAARARSAGIFGEAVLPDELLALVQAALDRPGSAAAPP